MLRDLKVVVDVQHLYRAHKPKDRGAVYRLPNGTTTTEASATLIYSQGLREFLLEHGAQVLTNDPRAGILIGHYSTRNKAAKDWGADIYLACHLNAGGGSYALMEYMSVTPARAVAQAICDSLSAAFPELENSHTKGLSSADRGAVCIERVASPAVAVLCEPFFGDNPKHQHLLAWSELIRVGRVIGEGVRTWWIQARPQVA